MASYAHQNPQWTQHVIKDDAWDGLDFSAWDQLENWDHKANIDLFDTTNFSINDVAKQVTNWIRKVAMQKIYSLKQIETARLIIRPLQLGDEVPLNKAVNNSLELLQKWLPWAKDSTIDTTYSFVQRGVFAWESGSVINFPMVVIHKEDQKIIGGSGYIDHSNLGDGLYEIGYWCDVDYQGKGYVTECVNALTQYALKELNAKTIVIRMKVDNLKSIAVAQRLNFENQGTKPSVTVDNATDYYFTCRELKNLPPLEGSWTYEENDIIDSQMIAWAKKTLKITDNKAFASSRAIIKTPWSNILEINTGNELVYLKQTPKDLFLEVEIIRLLHEKCGFTDIPEIIAVNSDYRCFIMSKCGDLTLRNYFSGNLNLETLTQSVNVYKSLQKATVYAVDDLIALGVPDWRLDKFPALYNDKLTDEKFLTENGLDSEQQQKLHHYSHKVKELCDELASYGVPECLNHSDFYDNNILYDKTAKSTAIIDLGETAINHPFFSMAALINEAKCRYKMAPDSINLLKLKQACYSDWLEFEDDTKAAIRIVEQLLLPVYLLFAHMRFTNVTSPVEFSKIPRMNDRVRKAFIWFIDNMESEK